MRVPVKSELIAQPELGHAHRAPRQRPSRDQTGTWIIWGSWNSNSCAGALFKRALDSDVSDIQDGTTAEGIHLGAMAGTVDLLQRCYAGIELRDDELRFNPVLPNELSRLSFQLRYRGHSLHVDITDDVLSIASEQASAEPVTLRLKGETRRLAPR